MNKIFDRDLSKIEGTYTHAIQVAMPTINKAYEDRTINAISFKSLVLDYVNGENIKKTPAQKRFILNLQKKSTKDQILYLVYSAWQMGSGDGVL